jgi:hypothetical protein
MLYLPPPLEENSMSIERVGIAASSILGLVMALLANAEDLTAPEPSAATEAGPAAAAPPARAKVTGELGMNYAPTAGAWRDKRIAARKSVLNATASLDEVNAEYARVLYEHPDDTKQAARLAEQRANAPTKLSAAKSAIPRLVENPRADGVSEKVLELYEQSLED